MSFVHYFYDLNLLLIKFYKKNGGTSPPLFINNFYIRTDTLDQL